MFVEKQKLTSITIPLVLHKKLEKQGSTSLYTEYTEQASEHQIFKIIKNLNFNTFKKNN